MRSKQEIFDTVKGHLLYQNCRSHDENDHPRYYGPWDSKCAMGCLIHGDHYDHRIEGYGVILTELRIEGTDVARLASALLKSGVNVDDEEILALCVDLQDCHDTISPDRWYCELDAIALKHGLAFQL
jgi:hypothetical protein